MKLEFLELCGFRGYQKAVRIEFSDGFTIIDGRNGVGKSTVFDAIEFALTGTLSKYSDAKAAGESVADYFWWTGKGTQPEARYVEVGFKDEDGEVTLRRTEFEGPTQASIDKLSSKLCNLNIAPISHLEQLCGSAIIRDEHITNLSLDMKEADRYTLLRDALGANDATEWINRGAELVSLAKQRFTAAQQEVSNANTNLAYTSRRVDEVRSKLLTESVIANAINRLRNFSGSDLTPENLVGPVRIRLADINSEISSLQQLRKSWESLQNERVNQLELKSAITETTLALESASNELTTLNTTLELIPSTDIAKQAHALMTLVNLGKQLGLHDKACPLCAKNQSHEEFHNGIELAESLALRLNKDAAYVAEKEQARKAAGERLEFAQLRLEKLNATYSKSIEFVSSFDEAMKARGIGPHETLESIEAKEMHLKQSLEEAEKDLRVLETIRLNEELEIALQQESEAKEKLACVQERFGKTRKALTAANALHDAARRAASETLDRRLERVLPLMSELFRRLRPHPVWNDIEYSIRGDVKRFLRLKVGDELNPQFLFSSGQRRATGLAFLLSVNLSLAWSRWKSILLDDPVQHVDDFRALHLAEVMAQLISEGRQLICSVEDEALADLLCRRLPVQSSGGKRITLGSDSDGALTKLREDILTPHVQNSLFLTSQILAS